MRGKVAIHRNRGGNKPYEPTADEIRGECERIQETWSVQERHKRAGKGESDGWKPPRVDWSALDASFVDETEHVAPIAPANSDW